MLGLISLRFFAQSGHIDAFRSIVGRYLWVRLRARGAKGLEAIHRDVAEFGTLAAPHVDLQLHLSVAVALEPEFEGLGHVVEFEPAVRVESLIDRRDIALALGQEDIRERAARFRVDCAPRRGSARHAVGHFERGNFEFNAQASAVAVTAGASADAAYDSGVAVFTHAAGGLMFEASIGGQRFKYTPKEN
jgi:hypothetical protein